MFNTYKKVKYGNSYSGDDSENYEDHKLNDQVKKSKNKQIIFQDI